MKRPLTIDELRKSDPFADGANLDLRGYPHLQPKTDTSWTNPDDPKTVLNDYLNSEEGQKEFVRLAPEAAEKIDEDERLRIFAEFMTEARRQGLPYFECEKNGQELSAMIEQRYNNQWTVENLRAGWVHLVISGRGILDPNEPRILSQEDEIRICRQAAQGDMQSALGAYLECRLPKNDVRALARADLAGYEAIFSKPRMQPYIREATLFAWQAGHPEIEETDELTNFLKRFTSKKLVFTFAMLDEGYDQFLKSQEQQQQAALLAPDVPTAQEIIEDFEGMSDEEAASTVAAARRALAKERR